MRDEIARLSSESIDEFSEYMAATINTDALVRLMKEQDVYKRQLYLRSVRACI